MVKALTLVLLAVVAAGASASLHSAVLPVFYSKRSITDYFYTLDIKEALVEFTMCMWLSSPSAATQIGHTLVSYATAAHQNEIFIAWMTGNRINFIMQNVDHYIMYTETQRKSMEGWHRHCFLWDKTQLMEWYVELTSGFELIRSATWTAITSLNANGALVLLEDQDSVLGGFDLTQTPMAKIAWFNLWRSKLTLDQLNALGCWDQGNVITMANFITTGYPVKGAETFPCRDVERSPLRDKRYTTRSQGMTFCKVDGMRLLNHIQTNMTASTVGSCMISCINSPTCVSINYKSTNLGCELNNVMDVNDPGSFVSSAGYVHYTNREC